MKQILACLSPSPSNPKILRAAADLARGDRELIASIACISNVGPGLSAVGPSGNYLFFSPLSKLILSLEMLLGRLEIFPMLFLFSPGVWKRM